MKSLERHQANFFVDDDVRTNFDHKTSPGHKLTGELINQLQKQH